MFENEVSIRKTFAIISHPDAGKTTMTEKLLLYGGAIRLAGSVKARKAQTHAVSDWMEIEKQRGISVTSSVLQFNYNGHCINILDTPGHQDFSEDTYRTLVAADCAVMLIDAAKGVEAQTIKLFHVCKMRGIPIFTFVNKMDRAAKDPLELMEEIENVLGIRSCPMNWPIGVDGDFQGIYNRTAKRLELFEGGNHGQTQVDAKFIEGEVEDDSIRYALAENYYERLCDEIELLDIAGDPFDKERVLAGDLTPMYFGSAMSNFGVQTFLEEFLEIAPSPVSRNANGGSVEPTEEAFSGFVFKIQANMNPTHRDRMAFIRVCSGHFEKGMNVWHTPSKKQIRLAMPQQMMAQERNIIEEAYAGDIIGLFDPGIFNIGDTLSQDNKNLQFEGIPVFPAEHFAKVSALDSMKRKQFLKGITQLAEEGAIQVFHPAYSTSETLIIGAVGVLQFEVLQHRLRYEYNVEISLQQTSLRLARWLAYEDPEANDPIENIDTSSLNLTGSTVVAFDKNDKPVLLFENDWSANWATEKNKGIKLLDIVEK